MINQGSTEYGVLCRKWDTIILGVEGKTEQNTPSQERAKDILSLDEKLFRAETIQMLIKLQGLRTGIEYNVKQWLMQAHSLPCVDWKDTLEFLHLWGILIPEISPVIKKQLIRKKYVMAACEALSPN